MSIVLASWYYDYYRTYKKLALNAWENITPMQYGLLLIGVALFGWILMKNGARR